MAAVISWRISPELKPANADAWEEVIQKRFGVLGGHVDISLVVQGKSWRVSLARIDTTRFRKIRDEVTLDLQAAGYPVVD